MTNIMDRPTDSRVRLADPAPPRDGSYSTTSRSPGMFPAAAVNSPMFEAKDIAGLVAAIVITLGPLAAYSLGMGA